MKLKIIFSSVIALMINSSVFSQEQKPNILIITIDDLNDWVGHLDGHPKVLTPHIDQLAANGVAFSNAHVQAPICNPSRTSFLTGLRPTTTGIYGLNPWFREADKFKEWVTLPQYFEANGYHTLTTGKVFHDAYPPEEAAKDGVEFTTWGYKGKYGPLPDKRFVPETKHGLMDWGIYPASDEMQDDWIIADWAIEHLKNPPNDKPFMMTVGFRHPHVPLYASQPWFDLYPEEENLLPVVRADDREDIPDFSWYLHWHLPEPRLAWLKMHHQWKNKVRAYLASVSFADMLVGRLMNTLEEQGLTENTIVVLLSDHGYHLGSKDITGKNTLWRESTRVPFVFAGPGILENNEISNEAVELLDLFPTLIDLAGLPSKKGLDGQSLKPILQDVSRKRDFPAICSMGPGNHAVITEQWRYIQYANGTEELYDMKQDPYEWENLADINAYAPIKNYLMAYIPKEVAEPAPGSSTRLVEFKDGKVYWQKLEVPPGTPVPMSFK